MIARRQAIFVFAYGAETAVDRIARGMRRLGYDVPLASECADLTDADMPAIVVITAGCAISRFWTEAAAAKNAAGLAAAVRLDQTPVRVAFKRPVLDLAAWTGDPEDPHFLEFVDSLEPLIGPPRMNGLARHATSVGGVLALGLVALTIAPQISAGAQALASAGPGRDTASDSVASMGVQLAAVDQEDEGRLAPSSFTIRSALRAQPSEAASAKASRLVDRSIARSAAQVAKAPARTAAPVYLAAVDQGAAAGIGSAEMEDPGLLTAAATQSNRSEALMLASVEEAMPAMTVRVSGVPYAVDGQTMQASRITISPMH